MQINLHIVGENTDEIRQALAGLTAGWTPALAPLVAAVTEENRHAETRVTPVEPEIATPLKKGRGGRKATADVTDINTNGDAVDGTKTATEVQAANAAQAAVPQPTVEDVRTAIKALMAATDENTTFKLIEKHGGKSASTLYSAGVGAAFIAEATTLTEAASKK